MLTFWGPRRRFCDRVTRRDFLRVGALGLGGLTLADVLRLRAQAGQTGSPRAVIMVCLAGGPSHIDMYDLKPDAPADVRGDFKPIKTNVPGFDICELMPAAGADRRQAGPGPHRAVRRADAARAAGGLHRLPQGGAAARVRLGHQPLPAAATTARAALRQPRPVRRRPRRAGEPAVRRRGPPAVPLRQRGRQEPQPDAAA